MIKFDEKEVAMVKRQASGSMEVAQSLKIKSKEDLRKAITLLSRIKQAIRVLKEKREEFTKPAKDIISSARALFKPLEDQCEEAERIVKAKMIDFNDKEEAKVKEKQEKVEKKVESGEMSFEKGSEKLEKITPKKTIESEGGKIQYKKIREIVIADESHVPKKYWMLDMPKIRKDALAGQEIAGVKVIEKKIVASL